MSRAGALAHVLSACIGVHLPASALNFSCLLPPARAPACKVARSLPPSRSQLHRVTQVETAGPTRPAVFGGDTPCPAVQVTPVPQGRRRAPCGVRPKAHAPIRRGAAMAGSTAHNAPALGAGWSNAGRPVVMATKRMHQNRTARWAAERLAGRITTAGGAAQKRQAGQARQWNHRCAQMHTDGPESGMLVRSQTRPAAPGEQGRRVGPAPSVCICVHLWFPFLAALPRAAPRPKRSRIAMRGKTPCTCAMAQRRRPPPRPACNETMVRLARD